LRDKRLTEFIRLFNDQHFFEAHEVLEELWLECSGEQRRFYQGLIQCAVALAHAQRLNQRGAKQVGARALSKLRNFGELREGILVDQLVRQCESFLTGESREFPKILTTLQ
jgi:uncharacterized protein